MITILDLVRAAVGEQDSYSGADHEQAGVAIMGGCWRCGATLASYNAYPSRGGSWACDICVQGDGYDTVAEYEADGCDEPKAVDAQGVYRALLAWKVEFDLANGTEPKTPLASGRGVGHADLLLQAVMLAFDCDSHEAELRLSEDWQEIAANRG